MPKPKFVAVPLTQACTALSARALTIEPAVWSIEAAENFAYISGDTVTAERNVPGGGSHRMPC